MNKYGNKCIAHCQFMLVKTLTNESYCYRVESTGMMIRSVIYPLDSSTI